jgi:hypothetical protein
MRHLAIFPRGRHIQKVKLPLNIVKDRLPLNIVKDRLQEVRRHFSSLGNAPLHLKGISTLRQCKNRL